MPSVRNDTISNLDAAINDFNDAIANALEVNVMDLSLDIYRRVTLRTPIKTGRARAAWNIAVDKENNSVPTYKKGKKRYQKKAVTSLQGVTPFSKVYITNSLPYIFVLEDGSSKQTGKHMLAMSFNEVTARVNSGF